MLTPAHERNDKNRSREVISYLHRGAMARMYGVMPSIMGKDCQTRHNTQHAQSRDNKR